MALEGEPRISDEDENGAILHGASPRLAGASKSSNDESTADGNSLQLVLEGRFSTLTAVITDARHREVILNKHNVARIQTFLEVPVTRTGSSVKEVREANARICATAGATPIRSDLSQRATGASSGAAPSRQSDASLQRESEDCSGRGLAGSELEEAPEMSKDLGPTSRFGDGDGSYWDRWLTTVGWTTTTGHYMPGLMPQKGTFATGQVMPRSGFKRYGLDALKLRQLPARSRVGTYSACRAQAAERRRLAASAAAAAIAPTAGGGIRPGRPATSCNSSSSSDSDASVPDWIRGAAAAAQRRSRRAARTSADANSDDSDRDNAADLPGLLGGSAAVYSHPFSASDRVAHSLDEGGLVLLVDSDWAPHSASKANLTTRARLGSRSVSTFAAASPVDHLGGQIRTKQGSRGVVLGRSLSDMAPAAAPRGASSGSSGGSSRGGGSKQRQRQRRKQLKRRGAKALLGAGPDLEALQVNVKYFGSRGRTLFHEDYREISRQRVNYVNGSEMGIGPVVLPPTAKRPWRKSAPVELVAAAVARRQSAIGLKQKPAVNPAAQEDASQQPPPSSVQPAASKLAAAVQTPAAAAAEVDGASPTAPASASLKLSPLNLSPAGNVQQRDRRETPAQGTEAAASLEEIQIRGDDDLDHSIANWQPTSRTRFLFACVEADLAPRASIMVRRLHSSHVRLGHLGMGDRLGLVLAQCLDDMPHMRHLELQDNRLTDHSLLPIVQSLQRRDDLLSLDLSENKLDHATSQTLAEYLAGSGGSLVALVLSRADIDDNEAAMLAKVLWLHHNITRLDLSHNLIGAKESLNYVQPSFYTGAEAIADWLVSPLCRLQRLDLSWNTIRLDSAVSLGNALSTCRSLVWLDLGYNGLGCRGGEAVAAALHVNDTLTDLSIEHNGISPRAFFVLCQALMENKGLRRIAMGGNLLGRVGARCVVQLPTELGDKALEVDVRGSNFRAEDPTCWFDDAALCPSYSLQLERPYDRAVALHLLRRAAWDEGLQVVGVKHTLTPEGDDESAAPPEEITLVRCVEGLEATPLGTADASEVFHKYDQDGAGAIPRSRLGAALDEALGYDSAAVGERGSSSDALVALAMNLYDPHGTGSIEEVEFCDFVVTHRREASKHKGKAHAFMASAAAADERWLVPAKGQLDLSLEFRRLPHQGRAAKAGHTDGVLALLAMLGEGRSAMMGAALEGMSLDTEQGARMYESVLAESAGDKVKALSQVLPRMSHAAAARLLVNSKLSTWEEKRRLRYELGPMYRPVMGLPMGHYSLDLSKASHRIAAQKVIEVANKERLAAGTAARPLDTSQAGDWENLRNERLNGRTFRLRGETLDNLPKVGNLEFDYVSTTRPAATTSAMSHSRFVQMLAMLDLLYPSEAAALEREGAKVMADIVAALPRVDRGQVFSEHLHFLHTGELPPAVLPRSATFAYRRRSSVAIAPARYPSPTSTGVTGNRTTFSVDQNGHLSATDNTADDESTKLQQQQQLPATATGGGSSAGSGRQSLQRRSSRSSATDASDTFRFARSSSRATEDPVGSGSAAEGGSAMQQQQRRGSLRRTLTVEETAGAEASAVIAASSAVADRLLLGDLRGMGGSGGSGTNTSFVLRSPTKPSSPMPGPLRSADLSVAIMQLDEYLADRWFSCTQLVFLLSLLGRRFKEADQLHDNLTELAVTALQRVVDLHNFDEVLARLPQRQQAVLFYRVGHLNLFNPCKPDAFWELSLSRREERQIAKMLIHLAVVEPGQNWTSSTNFRWAMFEAPVGGWQLPKAWLAETGIPTKGVLSVRYFSGGGKGLNSCQPDWSLRVALARAVVLCGPGEELIREYGDKQPPVIDKAYMEQLCASQGIGFFYGEPPAGYSVVSASNGTAAPVVGTSAAGA